MAQLQKTISVMSGMVGGSVLPEATVAVRETVSEEPKKEALAPGNKTEDLSPNPKKPEEFRRTNYD